MLLGFFSSQGLNTVLAERMYCTDGEKFLINHLKLRRKWGRIKTLHTRMFVCTYLQLYINIHMHGFYLESCRCWLFDKFFRFRDLVFFLGFCVSALVSFRTRRFDIDTLTDYQRQYHHRAFFVNPQSKQRIFTVL